MNVLFKTSYIFEGFLFSTEQNTIRYRMNTCKKNNITTKTAQIVYCSSLNNSREIIVESEMIQSNQSV